MSKPRYIAHTGGKHPVGDDVIVEVVWICGSVSGRYCAGDLDWSKHPARRGGWIIAYRVIK